MSDTITQNFVQQFDTSLRLLAAQIGLPSPATATGSLR